MRPKTIGILLVSSIVAWVLSCWLTIGISYLRPIYVELQVKSEMPLTFLLSTSKDGQFPRTFEKHVRVRHMDDWQQVRMAIEPHTMGYLRLGFQGADKLQLKGVFFNGHPLDLVSNLSMRNIRSCNKSEGGEISCILVGEQGSIIFSPEQLPIVETSFLWKWQIIFFLLSFVLCGWICKRYENQVFTYLRGSYPNWLLFLLFILLFAAYASMRWYAFAPRLSAVFFIVGWPQFVLLLQEQFWALAFLSGLLWLGFFVRNKWAKSACILTGTAILLTEWTDSVLLWLLNERFSPEQIGEFGGDALSSAWPFLTSYFATAAGKYTLLLLVAWSTLGVYLWHVRLPLRAQLHQFFGVVAILGFVWYLLPVAMAPAERNQLAAWPRLWLRSKMPVKKQTAPAPDFQLTYQCTDGLNSRQNVILIIVESLSSYMSDYFSGGQAENWTPHLDKLARRYAGFTNYRANAPYTAQNLFSIFTGIPAIYAYSASQLYHEPKFYHHTLAKTFHEAGYHTAFFTSASVVCSKDEILKRVGFDEISQNTDAFYNGEKRFTFQSVSDDVLYDHAQDWISHYTNSHPYLLVLETTTTHPPYIDPQSGEKSLEKTVRYADQALGKFVMDLEQKHILDKTLVVIASDHRSNTPLQDVDRRLFGPEAASRVPLVVIGNPFKGAQNVPATHIDLVPSLAYLTLPQVCFHPYQQNIFTGDKERTSCTLFQSGIEKGIVFINCREQHAKISLRQESNSFTEGQLPKDKKNAILGFINWIRDNGRY